MATNTYVDLNGEEIFITKITSNKINVRRGQDGTTITDHLTGEEIFIINAADTALIETGDDFGFDGGRSAGRRWGHRFCDAREAPH